ncbi:hypothetical protein ONS95_008705 [Cadophora gregata]|uniref:uncharacterized protein n=1 Tax=Cadophora gregata TaxID=51156 RepID=UPI0026DC959D|nr:uncharacterized protein ONS95_008705 [Cadophora gregata]KAK0123695.1 hypothetical protein ONS95_008705 [Cadophora gregata]
MAGFSHIETSAPSPKDGVSPSENGEASGLRLESTPSLQSGADQSDPDPATEDAESKPVPTESSNDKGKNKHSHSPSTSPASAQATNLPGSEETPKISSFKIRGTRGVAREVKKVNPQPEPRPRDKVTPKPALSDSDIDIEDAPSHKIHKPVSARSKTLHRPAKEGYGPAGSGDVGDQDGDGEEEDEYEPRVRGGLGSPHRDIPSSDDDYSEETISDLSIHSDGPLAHPSTVNTPNTPFTTSALLHSSSAKFIVSLSKQISTLEECNSRLIYKLRRAEERVEELESVIGEQGGS